MKHVLLFSSFPKKVPTLYNIIIAFGNVERMNVILRFLFGGTPGYKVAYFESNHQGFTPG